MWKYIRKYLPLALLAVAFMAGEVFVDLAQPRIMSSIVDDGVLGVDTNGVGDMQLILHLGLQMTLLVLLGFACGSANAVCTNLASQNMGNGIRKDVFAKIMGFSFQQTDKFSTGSLVTRVTNDISQVERLIAQMIRGLIRTTLLTFGSLGFLLRLNKDFALIISSAIPLMILTAILCLRKVTPLFTKLQQELDNVNQIMQEDITGLRVIKACVREAWEKLRFGKANEALVGTQLRLVILLSYMTPALSIIMNMAMLAVIYVGSIDVSAGNTSPGSIMAAITYTAQLMSGVMMLVMLSQMITRGLASWKRVREILECEPAIENGSYEGRNGELYDADVVAVSRERLGEHGSIEFEDVSFCYPGTDKPVLRNINLKIAPGETVAILGATGCGKSTLVNLIPRFYDCSEGRVLVDGRDVREYDIAALRERISIALQKSELFNRSIFENIRWGEPGIGSEAIIEAAKIAQAHDFISAMPDGYNSMVTEKGTSLSGGQKQRISLARAVLKLSDILVFDDATSALDLKTEASFYEALKADRPGITKVIVAQRIASVRSANRIVVLDRGRIAGVGRHDELMRDCSIYRDIYESQLGKPEEEKEVGNG